MSLDTIITFAALSHLLKWQNHICVTGYLKRKRWWVPSRIVPLHSEYCSYWHTVSCIRKGKNSPL